MHCYAKLCVLRYVYFHSQGAQWQFIMPKKEDESVSVWLTRNLCSNLILAFQWNFNFFFFFGGGGVGPGEGGNSY